MGANMAVNVQYNYPRILVSLLLALAIVAYVYYHWSSPKTSEEWVNLREVLSVSIDLAQVIFSVFMPSATKSESCLCRRR